MGFFRCHRKQQCSESLPTPASNPRYDDWLSTRRSYIRGLRCQTKSVILILAMWEAMERSSLKLVYAGRHGYPAPGADDYGIVYTVACLLCWIYLCAFMVVYVPFFSWWIPESSPSDPDHPTFMEKVSNILRKFNLVWLPLCIGISLFAYIVILVETFIFVEERRSGSSAWQLPKNTKKGWKIRGLLLGGILLSTTLGYGALHILGDLELARVKPLEYALIVIPVQINIGLMIGTKWQRKMEKRAAAKQSASDRAYKVDEKTELEGVMVVDAAVPKEGAIAL